MRRDRERREGKRGERERERGVRERRINMGVGGCSERLYLLLFQETEK